MASDRFERAIAAIDAANAADPNRLLVDGVERPKEQAHAEAMSAWVRRLDPGADEAQLLAARAHHLRRWSLPRADFPDGRNGYLRWRAELKQRHAAEVATILTDVGYDEATIERVQRIVTKRGLSSDPAVQTHEDALCLVFLRTQFDDLADKVGHDKMVDVVRKTLAKMSDRGRSAALEVPLSASGRSLVGRALAGS